ncbi:MAG TPA: glycosyltransferase family 1 protein [Cytophagaceae bacterium]|jgi:phosphatidylinositol alpha 1,6-mannosyltransferase|nr:glycosyltransferase family 1 protein [Cytophagaceae bacterium]
MKVLYFAETIRSNHDGVTSVLDKIREYNKKNGIEFLFVTSVGNDNEALKDDYVLTRSLPIPGYKGYRFSISSDAHIIKLLNEFKPDIIHIHVPFLMGWSAIRIAKKLNIPCIATYHTHFASFAKHHRAGFLESLINSHNRFIYNACALTIAPSNYIYTYLKNEKIKNLCVLPHGVDAKRFHPKHKCSLWRSQFGKEKTILLYVGRIVWVKNLMILAQALKELFEIRNDFEFVFVGVGPAQDSLKELLPQAHFLGLKTGVELSNIYASCDVFVFPSDTETFGNVTIEAMASGLPCIVANKGGSVDLVEDMSNGILFDSNDSSDLKKAITLLLNHKDIRELLSIGALGTASHFAWDNILASMEEMYKRTIQSYN